MLFLGMKTPLSYKFRAIANELSEVDRLKKELDDQHDGFIYKLDANHELKIRDMKSLKGLLENALEATEIQSHDDPRFLMKAIKERLEDSLNIINKSIKTPRL